MRGSVKSLRNYYRLKALRRPVKGPYPPTPEQLIDVGTGMVEVAGLIIRRVGKGRHVVIGRRGVPVSKEVPWHVAREIAQSLGDRYSKSHGCVHACACSACRQQHGSKAMPKLRWTRDPWTSGVYSLLKHGMYSIADRRLTYIPHVPIPHDDQQGWREILNGWDERSLREEANRHHIVQRLRVLPVKGSEADRLRGNQGR